MAANVKYSSFIKTKFLLTKPPIKMFTSIKIDGKKAMHKKSTDLKVQTSKKISL